MSRVLVTAFEPYGDWSENASWLTLVELTRDLPNRPQVTTRRYPVDYDAVREQLEKDLADEYDFAIHLGQAPGSSTIRLETLAINQASNGVGSQSCRPLVSGGPVAYQTAMPAEDYCHLLRENGFPALVSRHAGTYLCNAALYFSHHIIQTRKLATDALFMHLPLDPRQVAREASESASMSARDCAGALRVLLWELERRLA